MRSGRHGIWSAAGDMRTRTGEEGRGGERKRERLRLDLGREERQSGGEGMRNGQVGGGGMCMCV